MRGPEPGGVRARLNETLMPTGMRCRVETDPMSALVRLTGVLDGSGAALVRDALLARLCDRPGPVVADLSGLRVTDMTAGRVFAEVRREVVNWPAADLLLYDPTGTVPGAPAWPTLDGALAALAATPLAAVLSAELPPLVDAAGQARGLAADGCERWDVPMLVEPASIAITEMVNNVVAHARTPMVVRVAPRDSALHVAVHDCSPRPPSYAGQAAPDTAGGRGLLLVDTIARRWGWTLVPNGKVVWCVLHPEDEIR